MEHSERTADMCGNRWKDQDLVIFLIFTELLSLSLI